MHDAGNFTIWTGQIPLFIQIGATYGFVMHALLALSATHIAWLTECPLVNQMAFEHRGIALKGLHEAIGTFSRENSDAVLAASLLLSWQATDWRGWTQLMNGTSLVIDVMQPWKNESQFGSFIAEQSTFPTAPSSPVPNAKSVTQPRKQDLEALQTAYNQLQTVERIMQDNREDSKGIAQLMTFIRSVRKVTPSQTPAQRFEMLNPLRTWLFWLPVTYLQRSPANPFALVTLAYYYTVALIVEPVFPEVGAAYFGSLSLGPIEEIARRLFSINNMYATGDIQTPLTLMKYPIDMVGKFRERMGWRQPIRTASFPTFPQTLYPPTHNVNNEWDDGPVYPYGNQGYSYSQEHIMPFKSEPSSAISPLNLDHFSPTGHFLAIPSPGAFGGYHSPSNSSFEEISYSDQGEEGYLYEPQASSLSGFTPHALWI